MNYYCLFPEVAGGIGEQSVLDSSVHPPVVSTLHYEFDIWPGDELLTTFPCYIVSEDLKQKIEASSIKGYLFDEVIVTKSIQFTDLYSERDLPKFYWLKVVGTAGVDDIGAIPPHRLVVSENALCIFRSSKIDNCDIEPYVTS